MAGAHTPRSLPVVLAELAFLMPWLVLVQGRDYWRIEVVEKDARRQAVSGSAEVRVYLARPAFSWKKIENGKVLIVQGVDGAERPFAVEAGATLAVSA